MQRPPSCTKLSRRHFLSLTGAALASVVSGVGAAAVKELMDEMTARPHSAEFTAALSAGSILLWVYTPDTAFENKATDILVSFGATNIHTNERLA